MHGKAFIARIQAVLPAVDRRWRANDRVSTMVPEEDSNESLQAAPGNGFRLRIFSRIP
jgi:hypothetical protein